VLCLFFFPSIENIVMISWCVNSNVEDKDTVFASIQLQDDTSVDNLSEGVIIEEDSNEVVVYNEDDDDDNIAGMQFVTEQIVTKQLICTKNNTLDCKYRILQSSWNLLNLRAIFTGM